MSKDISILRSAYKTEKNAKIRERILMIIYSLEGESSWTIGKRLQCDHALVLYWKKRYKKEGIEGLKTRPRSGKPRSISIQQEAKLKRLISKEDPLKPLTTKRAHELIVKNTKVKYTSRHVARILHRWTFHLSSTRPTYWRRASEKEIKQFGKKNQLL